MRPRTHTALAALLLLATTAPAAGATELDDATAAWGRVLERFVTDDGRVDFAALAADPADLDRFVEFVAETAPWNRPELFGDRSSEIAFHVNAYNALSMRGILDDDIPDDLGGIFKRYSFFKRDEYRIGGREMSLHAYENEVIRGYGEPRVHFGLNCMSVGCPRLRTEPFTGAGLDEQLDAATTEFFTSERHVRVDERRRRVRVSEILKWFREDFVGDDGTDAELIGYVNRYRDEDIPVSYDLGWIDYDWTVIAVGR